MGNSLYVPAYSNLVTWIVLLEGVLRVLGNSLQAIGKAQFIQANSCCTISQDSSDELK